MTAAQILFGILFPEKQMFKSHFPANAAHCIIRAMMHIRGDKMDGTYPSTAEGVLLPFDVKVS